MEPRWESNYLQHMFVAGAGFKDPGRVADGTEPPFNLKVLSLCGDISVEKT